MDKQEAKEFSHYDIYGLNEMLSLINDQTQEIGYLHDKLDDIATRCNVRITSIEGQLEDLSEYPDCHGEINGEYDFYDK